MGKLFGVFGWSDVITGVASGVGLAFGGPPGAALLGGVAGTLTARFIDHQSWTQAAATGAITGAGAFLVGGPFATAERGVIGGGIANTFRSLKAFGSNSTVERELFKKTGQSVGISGIRSSLLARTAAAIAPVERRLIGSAASGLAATVTHGFRTPDESDPGFQSIPTKPVAYSSNMPPELEQVERPDIVALREYPARYQINDGLWKSYEKMVPPIFETPYKNAGQGLKTVPPVNPAPRFEPNDAALKTWGKTSSGYQDVVIAMNKSLAALVVKEKAVLPLVQETNEIVDGYKADLVLAVGDLNQSAAQTPPQGTIEDIWVMDYITASSKAVTDLTEKARNELANLAKGLKPDPAASSTPDPALQQLHDAQQEQAKKQAEQDAAIADLARKGAQDAYDRSNAPDQNGGSLDDLFGKNKSVGDLTDTAGNPPDVTNHAGPGSNPTGTGGNPTPVNDSNIPATSGAAGGSGFDPSSLLMSMLPSMMMNRNNDDYGNRYDGIDPERYDRNQQPLLPIQATPAVNTPQTPAAAPPPANTATPAPATPANNTPTTTPPPARVPGPNEGVNYTFPDGVTQLVSYTVKLALTAAFANHAGTDAQAAYANTGAKWTDNKQIGTRVDPNEAMTGDVALWQDPEHAALVRVIGSGADATMDVIIAGQLIPLNDVLKGGSAVFDGGGKGLGGKGEVGAPGLPQAPDGNGVIVTPDGASAKSGDTGAAKNTSFAGFAHPRSIEVSSVSAKDSGGSVPSGSDPAPGTPIDAPAVPVS
ncbi:hypothetical protein [Nocardia tengchongensis]|uniref:hypothetical protein n=1 Tax=Nocardia tengchongensis TaxID=2055889 RepID=UPI0036C08226